MPAGNRPPEAEAMPWPSPQDYNEAIQNPGLNCDDPDLRAATPDLTPLGLPRAITGGFASVYRLRGGGRERAVRCFLREFADQQQRYAAIGRHLAAARLPYTVGFDFLPRGIRIGGRWYPVLKMAWAPGEPLNAYIERHLGDGAALRALADRWVTLLADLRRAGVAHGDLQHGNVLVAGGRLRLLDYDGMFVPALAGGRSHEVGHRNYQHPLRAETDFGPDLDRFAGWVVYLSIRALSVEPALWQSSGAGDEQLLFGRADFEQPQSSATWRALAALPDPALRSLVADFRDCLAGGLADVPPLDGLASQRSVRKVAVARVKPARGPAPAWVALGARPAAILPGTSGAAWLVDHVGPAAPIALGVSGAPERRLGALVLVLAVLLAAIAPAGLVTPGLAALVIALALAGLPVGLACRFWRLPEATRKLGAAWRCWRARAAISGSARALARLARDRAALDRHEAAALAALAAQGRDLSDRERAELAAAEAILTPFVAEGQALRQAEAAERAAALDALRARALADGLAAHPVVRADLPDLGARAKLRLLLAGVRTAADVVAVHPPPAPGGPADGAAIIEGAGGRRVAVTGVGPDRARALLAWRRRIEAGLRRTLPRALPPERDAAIGGKYGRRRAALARREARAVARAGRRQDAIRRRYRARCDRQAEALATTRALYTGACRENERRARERQALLARQRRALALAERERAAYRQITFDAYLRRILFPRGGG